MATLMRETLLTLSLIAFGWVFLGLCLGRKYLQPFL